MKALAIAELTDSAGGRHRGEILALTDASVLTGGKPLFLPEESHRYVLCPSLGILTCNTGRKIAPRFVHRYCQSLTVAALLWDLDELDRCRTFGLPYTRACSFDFSLPRGKTIPFSVEAMERFSFTFRAGDREQTWSVAAQAPDWRERLGAMSRLFTFRTGDLLLPALGPGLPVAVDTHVSARCADTDNLEPYHILDFNIK